MASQQAFRDVDLAFAAAVFVHQGGSAGGRLYRVGGNLAVHQHAATIGCDGDLSMQTAVQRFDLDSGYVDLRNEHQ
ncbi:MAG: hypothetical protein ACU0B7_10750 [Paracoccaceae bacterium]|uniref:hypothetical protein n=1 Tax=Seohaeicola saemankumensis TaxID=481181 RepID=UPI001E55489E|nr:hypothetical protein [Seohaeicola saemankumensis]MCD1624741.1 hypothetical protein [Seohaeicola saemankumensis]